MRRQVWKGQWNQAISAQRQNEARRALVEITQA